jgi:hypothetical protein
MSQENVEVVVRMLGAWTSGDREAARAANPYFQAGSLESADRLRFGTPAT